MSKERQPSKRIRQTVSGSNIYPVTESNVAPYERFSVVRPFQPRPSTFRSLNGGRQQHFGAPQGANNVQAGVPHFFQNRARVRGGKYPCAETSLYGLSSNSGNFGPKSSHSCGDFRGVVRNVFQQNFHDSRTQFNSNQCGYRYMAHQGIPDQHQNQTIALTTGRQICNPDNAVRHTVGIQKSHSTDNMVMNGPSGSGQKSSSIHKNACGGMSSLPIVCCKSECGPFTDKWLKVMFYMSLDADRDQKESQGWFFMSTARPVITFAQNSDLHDLPHYHISRPLFISPHQLGRKMQNIPIPNEISNVRDNFNFSVLSYNILSDELLWQTTQLYTDCPGWTLQWEYRKDNLIREIESYNADVSILILKHTMCYLLPT